MGDSEVSARIQNRFQRMEAKGFIYSLGSGAETQLKLRCCFAPVKGLDLVAISQNWATASEIKDLQDERVRSEQ